MRSIVAVFALAVFAAAAAPAKGKRSQIVPRVDHHQHIIGSMSLEPAPASLPAIELPAELDRVLRAREKDPRHRRQRRTLHALT